MIKDLAKAGTTILLTTQYMEEADYLAKNIIVLDHGVIIAEGTPAELKAKAGADRVSLSFSSPAQAKKATALLKTDVVNDTQISLPAKKGVESLQDTLNLLKKNSIKPDTAAISRPTLDDVFLTLTGHTAEVKKDQEAKK
jgi:ABC-2 type transport system ATP-binding protein